MAFATSGTVVFKYDVLDNLTQLTMPATDTTTARNQYYCYDSTTRRLASLRSAAGCTGTIQTSLTYDARGNIATKGGMTFDFDLTNRLKSIDNGGVVENYRYDGYGLRALKNASSGNLWSQYTRDGRLLQEVNARAGIQTEYVYLGGSLVAERETPTAGGTAVVKYQHTDALGTPVAVTSASRTVLTRNEYEPYGQLLNHTVTDAVGYTGHVQDALTGLTYMQQRYYDPMIGRFLSVDPVTATSVGGNFNRYWYGNDNPYKFSDPDGRKACGKNTTCQLEQGAYGGTTYVNQSTPSRTYAFDGAGGRSSGNNQEFQDVTSSRYKAHEFDTEVVDGNSALNSAINDAQAFIKKNSDGAIYVLGYSAGGHDAIAFTHYLASINIAVRGMALFDPHSKFSLGRLNFDVPNNVGVTLNFFQTRPISIGQNTFQGSQVTGNNVFNVDVSYLPGMSHSSIFSDVMSQFGGQVDHVMGR